MSNRKTIDWNEASELGLVERINKEILHPLGLAMARDSKTGASPLLFLAPDKLYEYPKELNLKPVLSKRFLWEKIDEKTKSLNERAK